MENAKSEIKRIENNLRVDFIKVIYINMKIVIKSNVRIK